jgi:hypothetical protein
MNVLTMRASKFWSYVIEEIQQENGWHGTLTDPVQLHVSGGTLIINTTGPRPERAEIRVTRAGYETLITAEHLERSSLRFTSINDLFETFYTMSDGELPYSPVLLKVLRRIQRYTFIHRSVYLISTMTSSEWQSHVYVTSEYTLDHAREFGTNRASELMENLSEFFQLRRNLTYPHYNVYGVSTGAPVLLKVWHSGYIQLSLEGRNNDKLLIEPERLVQETILLQHLMDDFREAFPEHSKVVDLDTATDS